MLTEYTAIRAIHSLLSTYEKMKSKLESAIESLRCIKMNNLNEIQRIEQKNLDLDESIEKAEKFKSNIEKMLN